MKNGLRKMCAVLAAVMLSTNIFSSVSISRITSIPLLRFLLKYESLIPQLRMRKQLLKTMEKNPEGIEQMHHVLDQYDSNVGIVKIVEDGFSQLIVLAIYQTQ